MTKAKTKTLSYIQLLAKLSNPIVDRIEVTCSTQIKLFLLASHPMLRYNKGKGYLALAHDRNGRSVRGGRDHRSARRCGRVRCPAADSRESDAPVGLEVGDGVNRSGEKNKEGKRSASSLRISRQPAMMAATSIWRTRGARPPSSTSGRPTARPAYRSCPTSTSCNAPTRARLP